MMCVGAMETDAAVKLDKFLVLLSLKWCRYRNEPGLKP